MPPRTDVAIVGGGILGLAVARELLAQRPGLGVTVLEREAELATHQTGRNSGVLHAGLYYTPGSLKARLCVRGKDLLYSLCASHGVPYAACGKLVVATGPEQHGALAALARRAADNGVPVEQWTAAQAQSLEPELACTAAVWSPSTGIVDSHALMLALQGDLERAGGMLALRSKVSAACFKPGVPARVRVQAEGGDFEIEARCVVNAAGLHACELAQNLEGLAPKYVPRPYFAKGSYFTLPGRPPFSHLVYPAPVDAWLGVHVTLDLAGQIKFGPDLEWLDVRRAQDIDYTVDAARAAPFQAAIRRYWPGLPAGALQPGYSGVRPRIHGPGESAPDFRIDGPALHGVAGLVNLFGIESPGLTSALAIAEHVAAMLASG